MEAKQCARAAAKVSDYLKFPDDDLAKSYYRVGFNGVSMAVAKSALQKSIRRGETAAARYWAAVLLASHKVANLYNRLLVISCEDIGPADTSALEQVVAAAERYKVLRSVQFKGPGAWKHLRNVVAIRADVDALVRMLCAAPKSRVCDHACIGHVGPIFDVPEAPPRQAPVDGWISGMCAKAGDRDIVGALECMAYALKCPQDKRGAVLEEILVRLKELGAGAAVRAARIVMSTKEKGSRPPFMPIVHGLFVAAGMGVDCNSKMVPGPLGAATVYRRLLHDPTPEVPDWVNDMHVHGVKAGAVRAFVVSENAALDPHVDPEQAPFLEREMYE
ncbi:MAG: hypothetical protein WC732_09805, partial [Candidatus Omnitrophota bacterium]